MATPTLSPGPAPFRVQSRYTLNDIKDYDGILHGGASSSVASKYTYQGAQDVNGDGFVEAIFTNTASGRMVTAAVDWMTGEIDFAGHGRGGVTRVVGIFMGRPGRLYTTQYPNLEYIGESERFQRDLRNDNLTLVTQGDYDRDGKSELYWRLNDGTACVRTVMTEDGNMEYADYQNEAQMSRYLYGHGSGQDVDRVMPGSFSHLVQAYDDPHVEEGERNGGNLLNGDSAPERYGPNDSAFRLRNDIKNNNLNYAYSYGDLLTDAPVVVTFRLADGSAMLDLSLAVDGSIEYARYHPRFDLYSWDLMSQPMTMFG